MLRLNEFPTQLQLTDNLILSEVMSNISNQTNFKHYKDKYEILI